MLFLCVWPRESTLFHHRAGTVFSDEVIYSAELPALSWVLRGCCVNASFVSVSSLDMHSIPCMKLSGMRFVLVLFPWSCLISHQHSLPVYWMDCNHCPTLKRNNRVIHWSQVGGRSRKLAQSWRLMKNEIPRCGGRGELCTGMTVGSVCSVPISWGMLKSSFQTTSP